MRTGIHPETVLGSVTCLTCGTIFALRSTAGNQTVDTCSQCHPAYTGRTAKATSGSRVERFERRLEIARTHRRSRAREYHRSFNS